MGGETKARREQAAARIREGFVQRFGAALTAAMAAAGAQNPTQFAVRLAQREIPVTQQDLSAWSKGRIPEWDRMEEMAVALGTPWQWLLIGEEGAALVREWATKGGIPPGSVLSPRVRPTIAPAAGRQKRAGSSGHRRRA